MKASLELFQSKHSKLEHFPPLVSRPQASGGFREPPIHTEELPG
jgi:hypothetical protein